MFHRVSDTPAGELAPEISLTDWAAFAVGCALCVAVLWVTKSSAKHDSSDGSSETNAKLLEFKLR